MTTYISTFKTRMGVPCTKVEPYMGSSFSRYFPFPLWVRRQFRKEGVAMLLFLLLAIVLTVMVVIAFTVLGAVGGVAAFIFADVIVCVFIVFMIASFIRKRKNQ